MNFPHLMPAALTFFDRELGIDTSLTIQHARNLLEDGADAILFFGTTGEANSLSLNERIQFIDDTSKSGIAKESVFWGTGCSNFKDTIHLTESGIKRGFKNFLLLPPFYYKNVSSKGIINYFEVVFKNLPEDVNLFLYHFPAMSAVEINEELLEYLTERFPNKIKGIKDSSGDWQRIFRLAGDFNQLKIYAGNEKAFLRCFNRGCAGIISASFNVQIKLARQTFQAFENRSEEMFELEKQLIDNRMLLERFPAIAAMKYLLSVKYNKAHAANVRPPLVQLTESEIVEANKLAEELSVYY